MPGDRPKAQNSSSDNQSGLYGYREQCGEANRWNVTGTYMQSDRLFREEGRRAAKRPADEAPLPAGRRIGGVQADSAGRGVDRF